MRALLINSTFFAVVLGALIALSPAAEPPGDRIRRLLARPIVAALLMFGALVNVAFVGLAGYINPRDYLQDVIAARQFLAGGTLYPPDLPERGIAELATPMPGRGFLESLPPLRGQFDFLNEPPAPANAHPPLAGILLALPVQLLGARGSFVFVFLLSTVLTALALLPILRELFPPLPAPEVWSWLGLLLGWHGVTMALRAAQPSLTILALITACWWLLRRDRPWLAGAAIAVAAWLHAFPALLGLYFLLRNRRAFLSMAVTGVAIGGLVALTTGPETFQEWFASVDDLSRRFLPQPGNISIAGILAALSTGMNLGWNLQAIATGVLVACVSVLVLFVRPWSPQPDAARLPLIDLEFSVFVIAAVLASPLSWSRYLPLLTLPLAILVHYAKPLTSLRNRALFFAVLAVLTFPDSTFMLLGERLPPLIGFPLTWLISSTPCFAMLGVLAWIETCKLVVQPPRTPIRSPAPG